MPNTAPPQGLDEFLGANNQASGNSSVPQGLDEFIGPEVQQEQYGTPVEQLKAGAEGLARGATFGLSDAYESKLLDNAEQIKGRKEANPITSMGSEIAGNIGTLAGTGGASELLGIGKIAGAGVEGAGLGLGQSISDTALGDPSLNAQKILSNVGFGFALGSGLGTLSKAVEVALPAATNKLNDVLSGLKERVLGTEEAPTAVAHALTGIGSTVAGEEPKSWAQAMYQGLDPHDAEQGIRDYITDLKGIYNTTSNVAEDVFREPALPKSLRSITQDVLENNPDRLAKQADYEDALKNFEGAFTKNGEVDPAKVKTFFNNYGQVGQDLKAQYLDKFIKTSQDLVDGSRNLEGFKAAQETLSDHISALSDKNQQLGELAQALTTQQGGRGAMAQLGRAYALHAVGAPKAVIGAGLLATDMYKKLANPYEFGNMLNSSFNKLKSLGQIIDKTGDAIEKGSKAIFSGSGKGAVLIPSIQGYDKRVDRISELSNNTQQLMDTLQSNTQSFNSAAPNIAQSINNTVLNGMQFLKSKIPAPGSNLLLSQEDWEPSPAQKMKFNSYYQAVENPLNILKQIKAGDLSNESMEAIQAVHPDLMNEMKKGIMQYLDPKKVKGLDQGTKIALSKFLGMPLDANMLPLVMANNQQALNAQKAPPAQSPTSKAKPSKGGMEKMTIAERAETETQQLEEENG